ncbi:uncharacterized protein C8Q71DRAFT_287914 [Rhodofomes roseus]|uniref:Secreted protein n=1 Tax=Rhodofomes roseus TaxID=34475 RepID=A0ABQ8K4L8_9APHY|nr:uncharacterized protein C8Q71DRAFT_287914 [Rhodofomes roseus]KAH9831859.1 hypothetical protein C8Q71DRAFT_287914 [Rhodofomes roseus]
MRPNECRFSCAPSLLLTLSTALHAQVRRPDTPAMSRLANRLTPCGFIATKLLAKASISSTGIIAVRVTYTTCRYRCFWAICVPMTSPERSANSILTGEQRHSVATGRA